MQVVRTHAASPRGKVLSMTAFSLPAASRLATSCIARPSGLTKPRWCLGPRPSVPSASLHKDWKSESKAHVCHRHVTAIEKMSKVQCSLHTWSLHMIRMASKAVLPNATRKGHDRDLSWTLNCACTKCPAGLLMGFVLCTGSYTSLQMHASAQTMLLTQLQTYFHAKVGD